MKNNHFDRNEIRQFYSQATIWWGDDPQDVGTHQKRISTLHQWCGKRSVANLGFRVCVGSQCGGHDR